MQNSQQVNYVISTCILRDASIWEKTSQKLLEHIQSENYILIVPKEEVSEFIKITPSNFNIFDEESIIGKDINWVREILPPHLINRAGWYFQQLLKIGFLASLKPGNIGVIWDADTIPLKNIKFIQTFVKVLWVAMKIKDSKFFRSFKHTIYMYPSCTTCCIYQRLLLFLHVFVLYSGMIKFFSFFSFINGL
jgi:hypothetical protein